MAKQNKKTRESQYTEILADRNKTLAQCSVLGFRFPDDTHAYGFHFDLMNNRAGYLLFDATPDGKAVVMALPEQADRIREIAEQAGGKEYKPNLNQC